MDIDQRLADLEKRGLSDQKITAIVLRIKQRLSEYWQADVTTQQVSMLLFHFACALGRIQRGYPVSALYREFLDEIESTVNFPQITMINQDLLQFVPFSVPEGEQTYLLANIYSLLLDQPKILKNSQESDRTFLVGIVDKIVADSSKTMPSGQNSC